MNKRTLSDHRLVELGERTAGSLRLDLAATPRDFDRAVTESRTHCLHILQRPFLVDAPWHRVLFERSFVYLAVGIRRDTILAAYRAAAPPLRKRLETSLFHRLGVPPEPEPFGVERLYVFLNPERYDLSEIPARQLPIAWGMVAKVMETQDNALEKRGLSIMTWCEVEARENGEVGAGV